MGSPRPNWAVRAGTLSFRNTTLPVTACQIKTLVTGREAEFVGNNMNVVRLKDTTLTNYSPEGQLEWVVRSPECTVNVNTREVHGITNMFFHTADEKLFLSGVGFLWQHTNSVLILSNQVSTWIDKTALTNSPLK